MNDSMYVTPHIQTRLDQLAKFLNIADAEKTDEIRDAEKCYFRDIWKINKQWWDSPLEIEILSRNAEIIQIEIAPDANSHLYQIRSSVTSIHIEQRFDDGNLLTELRLLASNADEKAQDGSELCDEVEAVIDLRGPSERDVDEADSIRLEHNESTYDLSDITDTNTEIDSQSPTPIQD